MKCSSSKPGADPVAGRTALGLGGDSGSPPNQPRKSSMADSEMQVLMSKAVAAKRMCVRFECMGRRREFGGSCRLSARITAVRLADPAIRGLSPIDYLRLADRAGPHYIHAMLGGA